MTATPDVLGQLGVDEGLCEANGICAGVAPEVFDLDGDERLHLLVTDVTPENISRIRQAVVSCPRAALRVEGQVGA